MAQLDYSHILWKLLKENNISGAANKLLVPEYHPTPGSLKEKIESYLGSQCEAVEKVRFLSSIYLPVWLDNHHTCFLEIDIQSRKVYYVHEEGRGGVYFSGVMPLSEEELSQLKKCCYPPLSDTAKEFLKSTMAYAHMNPKPF